MIWEYLWLFGLAFFAFWFGYGTACALIRAKEEDEHAALLADLGRTLKGKHDEGVFQDPNPEDQALVVGEILERKRTPSGRIKKNPKGNQAEV